ncbi:MAG TPA: hypothetical protein VIO16_08830 [Dehalococcoidia bacterium]
MLLVLALLVLLASYTIAQVTSRSAAERIIGRAIPGITDFDHAFAAHYDELQTAAASPSGARGVTLSSYPVKAQLSPSEVINKSPIEVRQVLLKRTARCRIRQGNQRVLARREAGKARQRRLPFRPLGVQAGARGVKPPPAPHDD